MQNILTANKYTIFCNIVPTLWKMTIMIRGFSLIIKLKPKKNVKDQLLELLIQDNNIKGVEWVLKLWWKEINRVRKNNTF